jgi:hypothetical protein
MNMPKSTWIGAASGAQASAIAKGVQRANKNTMAQADAPAKQIQEANSNTMQQFDRAKGHMEQLQSTGDKNLQVAQEALEKLEKLSAEQGSGQVTLFFKIGSAKEDRFQYQRLVNLLNHLAGESRGQTIIMVSIGSAPAIGTSQINKKLSMVRSEAPLPTIDQYLVNVPHKFYNVTGIGDLYALKNAPREVGHRGQSVRIIAAYGTADLPATPGS